ncbi:Panacea domain-containing protein [Chryseolinea lacunae]|uniref:SocA family protein n=1 Tax=Chryseolinea lacunae TaxID=2801331 RepID=A0ABS1KMK1_9BACT|nr:Panacea domain-containing protein [Chryseolinea lacunae]MBL0739882.1 SocA family protein [Chryseolinea lacunae]
MKKHANEISLPNLDKIGNLIIYIVDGVKKKHHQKVYLTKLLKLLYIIDETSVKETGTPVTGLDYRVWKMGPVAYSVYKDLVHDEAEMLSSFAEVKKGDAEQKQIVAKNSFDDAEFSDFEMGLIDRVLGAYGHYQSDALIALLHEDGSLWRKIVNEKHLDEAFAKENTSPYSIDLSQLIAGDPHKLELFKNAQESLNL